MVTNIVNNSGFSNYLAGSNNSEFGEKSGDTVKLGQLFCKNSGITRMHAHLMMLCAKKNRENAEMHKKWENHERWDKIQS